jgi:antitoxin component HigA of HigAB toxin-antitoxin module
MNINKSAVDFIISRLKEMVNTFENIHIKYSYDDIANFHVIEVAPNNIRYEDRHFVEMEAALWKDFAENYPREEICIDEFDDLNDANETLYENTPSLVDMLKLRMYEMGITQVALSKMIGVSPSRLSDYMSGKCEPTLKIARTISQKLRIDAHVVLGV